MEDIEIGERLESLQRDNRQLIVFMYNGFGLMAAALFCLVFDDPYRYIALLPAAWLMYSSFMLTNKLKRYMK
jgi:hypothetical protein